MENKWFTKREEPSLNIKRIEAKKRLRSEQRRAAAQRRIEKVEKILASRADSRTFARMANQQRKTINSNVKSITVGGVVCDTSESVCNGWAEHFGKLAEPLECEQFDKHYQDLVHRDILFIKQTVSNSAIQIENVTESELHSAFLKLKNNKAADIMNLTSEHFKFGKGAMDDYLLALLNFIVEKKSVSPVLKEGLLTPIYKKGDKSDPSNYRGITVTPVFLKLLEHILNERHNKILLDTQSRLQKDLHLVAHQWERPWFCLSALMRPRTEETSCM